MTGQLIIDRFEGEHTYLSNFYIAPMVWVSKRYGPHRVPSVEYPYQAEKARNREDFEEVIRAPSSRDAKRRGRSIPVRSDWEAMKLHVMMRAVRLKFETHPELRVRLLATGEARLIEGNDWHDIIWGQCRCKRHNNQGQNLLGRVLMAERSMITTRVRRTNDDSWKS